MSEVPILNGVSQIDDRYDGYIVDLWGVLHDGVQAFPKAVNCLKELKTRGKRIAILSNAPRRSTAVAERNAELGIDKSLCDFVLSSGEVAWQRLKDRTDPWYSRLGRRCYQLGPERDLGMRNGLDYEFVATIEDADLILLTGPPGFHDKTEDFRDLLLAARRRNLPMVCANPDLEVIRGGRREICAGAIAVYYEEMGGDVRTHGKPDREVYDLCLAGLGLGRETKVAMIGDSLRTDIAGALGAGLDGIFVAEGIHGELLDAASHKDLDPARLNAFCGEYGLYPTAALSHLVW